KEINTNLEYFRIAAKEGNYQKQWELLKIELVYKICENYYKMLYASNISENSDALKGIKEEIKVANSRIDKAENWIEEAEERLQHIEEATMELLELLKRFETWLVDQEGRSRRENVQIHGLKEGAEDGAGSMTEFVEKLLREKLELWPSFPFQIERAHRALPPCPSPESPPRSIVVKFMSFRVKEEILKKAWQKKGFMYEGKKVFLDHDYAPEVLKKRKEYTEAKRVLREKKIRSQTPFPARLWVFYEGETRIYNTAEE
uniref:L1 transposable element RRM domain-containing protein n=1 Tax=Poecilia formosa TaxID=48698 RepID=A0A087X478_POEFO